MSNHQPQCFEHDCCFTNRHKVSARRPLRGLQFLFRCLLASVVKFHFGLAKEILPNAYITKVAVNGNGGLIGGLEIRWRTDRAEYDLIPHIGHTTALYGICKEPHPESLLCKIITGRCGFRASGVKTMLRLSVADGSITEGQTVGETTTNSLEFRTSNAQVADTECAGAGILDHKNSDLHYCQDISSKLVLSPWWWPCFRSGSTGCFLLH